MSDRLEIRNFSSSVYSTLKEKFRISARPCNILYLFAYQLANLPSDSDSVHFFSAI